MSEGRAELQRIILQYEKQRAEAIRSKQEAEVVLPFVRAGLEELDSALGNSEDEQRMERVQSQVESARTAQEPVADEQEAAAGEQDEQADDQGPAAVPTPMTPLFGSTEDSNSRGAASIASLLEEDSKVS